MKKKAEADRPPHGWRMEYQMLRKDEWKPCTPVIAYDSSQATAAAAEALRAEGIKWRAFRVKKVVSAPPRKMAFKGRKPQPA